MHAASKLKNAAIQVELSLKNLRKNLFPGSSDAWYRSCDLLFMCSEVVCEMLGVELCSRPIAANATFHLTHKTWGSFAQCIHVFPRAVVNLDLCWPLSPKTLLIKGNNAKTSCSGSILQYQFGLSIFYCFQNCLLYWLVSKLAPFLHTWRQFIYYFTNA